MDIGETFRDVDARVGGGRVGASYYPYKDLKHTWRTRDGRLSFRISDYMRGSPDAVIESLAWYLICRARGRECPSGLESNYVRHTRSAEFWAGRRAVYISRARNLLFRPSGDAHDLAAVFDYVNSCYFHGGLGRPDLAWVKESPSRRVGFLHQPLGILAVNRTLDSERVPRFVLEFVMYHELLHGALDCDVHPDRCIYHTKEFRAKEREFNRYDEAQKWLARITSASGGRSVPTEIVPQV